MEWLLTDEEMLKVLTENGANNCNRSSTSCLANSERVAKSELRHIVSKLEEIGFDSVAQETFSISYKDWNELKEESK